MATSPGLGVNFVFVSEQPDDEHRKKKIRSHAAKNAKARRQKVIAYQAEKARGDEAARSACQDSWEPLNFFLPLSPQTILSAARKDPFQSFKKPPTPFESFLLDHCMTPSFAAW